MARSKSYVHKGGKSRRHKRRTHKRRSHKRRSHKRRSDKRRSHARRHRLSIYHIKQRGGFNKDSDGHISYLSMDNRYRPFGGVMDSASYNASSLLGNIQGNYKSVNPSVSSQPIGNPLDINDFKFTTTK